MRAPTRGFGLPSQALILLLSGCAGGGGGGGAAPPSPTPTPTPPPASGLDSRPSNTTCLAGDAPDDEVPYGVQEVYPNLPNFTQPVAMLQEPGESARWYVVQKTGQVLVFDNTANVSTTRTFIDISTLLNSDPGSSNDERGLLGMAFHPDYPDDPRVYLFYTGTETGLGLVDRVSEFRTLDDGDTLSPGTEVELFNVDDPAGNHNGGNIAFGPDGYLYIGIGDGGGGNDQFGSIGNGQRLTILLGKMLRIDVATPATPSVPYAIPSTNPFAGNARCNANGTGTANCPEIYAYGFRNPWRWSFDRLSNELWLNDVGQGSLEEVDRVTLGGNYGWRCFEGTTDTGMACGPNKSSSIPPIAQYGRSLGGSTTGGFVYRGTAMPTLIGRYVFGDFSSGNIWHIARDTSPTLTLTTSNMLDSGLLVASFAQDTDGELYVVNL
ncbi:MAG TPA: PQQ-dependent sugar dehydrogenase, partial [Steroidobacteraceae bacterium]|nr:PQQ-dependent sugar dehydrogenase [Steroidobacteraceae bacterium]